MEITGRRVSSLSDIKSAKSIRVPKQVRITKTREKDNWQVNAFPVSYQEQNNHKQEGKITGRWTPSLSEIKSTTNNSQRRCQNHKNPPPDCRTRQGKNPPDQEYHKNSEKGPEVERKPFFLSIHTKNPKRSEVKDLNLSHQYSTNRKMSLLLKHASQVAKWNERPLLSLQSL